MVALPNELLYPSIGNMQIGDERWCAASAMVVDEDRQCYLNVRATVYHKNAGVVQMFVRRDTDGYHVNVPSGATYQPESLSEGTFVPVESLTVGV